MKSEQLRAGRALLRWSQADLAEASKVSGATIKRLELQDGEIAANGPTLQALRIALETAGVIFLDEGHQAEGGAGVRLRKNDE